MVKLGYGNGFYDAGPSYGSEADSGGRIVASTLPDDRRNQFLQVWEETKAFYAE